MRPPSIRHLCLPTRTILARQSTPRQIPLIFHNRQSRNIFTSPRYLTSAEEAPRPASRRPRLEELTIPATPPTTAMSQDQLPYHVPRSPSGNLQVYARTKNNGTQFNSIIRHIEGDRAALKYDLAAEMGLREGDVTIHPVSGSVVVKGMRTQPIKDWLSMKGF